MLFGDEITDNFAEEFRRRASWWDGDYYIIYKRRERSDWIPDYRLRTEKDAIAYVASHAPYYPEYKLVDCSGTKPKLLVHCKFSQDK